MHILIHQKTLCVLAFHVMCMLMYSLERTLHMFAGVKSNCIKRHCMLPSTMPPMPSSISSCFLPPGKLCHSVWQLGSTNERSDGTEGRNMCWGVYSPYSSVLPAVPGAILPICLSSSPALLKYTPTVISRPRCGDS